MEGARRISSGTVPIVSFLAMAIAAGLCGCAVIGERHVLEEQFTLENAGRIRSGMTTKSEILDWFGPPSEISRAATPVTASPPGENPPESVETAPDTAIWRFAAARGTAHGAVQGHVLYGYRDSTLAWSEFCAYGQYGGGCIPTTPALEEKILWILVDESTGRVADHFIEKKKREENSLRITPWPQ